MNDTLRRDYNVRVLIPCYKESLAIIQRTVLAAKRADRPPGTRLFIYVCDDGNDPKKLAWVQQINDPEIMYVTGRDKSLRSLNGKSANLNYCLQLLFPDVTDPENPEDCMKIPVNELMCLFDADQTCSRGFFQVCLLCLATTTLCLSQARMVRRGYGSLRTPRTQIRTDCGTRSHAPWQDLHHCAS